MNSKKLITLLLVFCLVLSGIAPAANAVHVAGKDNATGSNSGWFQDLIASAGKVLGFNSVRDDQSHLKDHDYTLSLKDGKWLATLADGTTVELTDAQLPEHIQVLRKLNNEYQPVDKVTVFVVLKDAPTADTYGSIVDVPADVKASMLAKQNDMLAAVQQVAGDVQLVGQSYHLTNAIVITTEFRNLEPIAAIAGVKTVFLNPEFEPMTAKEETLTPYTISSTNMTNVAQVWQDLGFTGEGMTIAVLDTGLDVDHPSFAAAPAGAAWSMEDLQHMLDNEDLNLETLYMQQYGRELTAEDLFYNEKVPFTFNYASPSTNVTHNDGLGDHGTHVAGIAAANAVEGSNVTGMAPDAQIFAMKVFSPTGGAGMYTIITALEDCMKLGVDVVNMSLGSAAGFSVSGDEEVDSVFRRIAESDMIVDVAVGNEGSSNAGSNWGYNKMPTTHIDNGTIASPATYANAMGIASVDNKIVAADYFALADGSEIFYQYSIEWMYGYVDVTMAHLYGMGDLEYVVIDGLGTEEDFYDENGNSIVEGKVALVKRGDIEFGRKAINAQNAGAVACIIWNTDDSDVFVFGMTTSIMDDYGNEILPEIPVCLITLSDGQKMADAETKTLIVTGDYSFREDLASGGQISSFSCWGTTGDLRLVPDLSGIGGNVYSTLDGGNYGLMSGTSMACPQVAGVTALVLQYIKETFPTATDAEVRELCDSLMMSTATTIIDKNTNVETSPRQQGAGLVNALGAITAEAYLTVPGSARPKVELGDNENGEFTFTFTVTNFSDRAKTYTLRSSLLCEDYKLDANYPGVYFLAQEDRPLDNSGVTFDKNTVTVAAGTSQEITVTIKLTEADKEWIHTYFPSGNYVEGYIYLEGEDEVTLSLPFLGFYERWDDAPLFDSGFWYEEGMWGVPGAAHTANQFYHLLWTSLGAGNDWMLGLNPYMSSVVTDENGQIIGARPYSPYNNVLSPNGDGAMDQITDMYISLMRNADEMEVIYTDENGDVIHYELLQKESKTMFLSNYGSVIPMVYSWYYDDLFDFANLEDGAVVYLTINGKIDFEDAESDVLFDKMPIYIDLSAPVMDRNSVKESTVDGRNYLTFTFEDAHPAAAVLMNQSGSQIYEHYGEEDMVKNEDGSWTVTVDVTGLGTDITVALCDYGCNEAYYNLTFTSADNAPNMDKSKLYAYQVYDWYVHNNYGWDSMFGWATIDKNNGKVTMLQSDAYEYYALNAAEYVGGMIFAVDAGGNFLYMEPGVWNRHIVRNLGYNVVDMAWDSVTETMYMLISDNESGKHGLYTIDLLTGELTELRNYYDKFFMPWAMTFVDGEMICVMQKTTGLYKVNFQENYQLEAIKDAQGNPVVPQGSDKKDALPIYAQSMTYSEADGKIYWAYYGELCQSLVTIDPTTWETSAIPFYYYQEYIGVLTMEDDGYVLPEATEVTTLVLSQDKLVMSAGKTHQLSVTLLPWNAPVTENVVWTSSDESIATVDQNGLVTAVGEGVVEITAAYGNVSVSCTLTVIDVVGSAHAYKYYDGNGASGFWLDIDLGTVTEQPSTPTTFDFLAADYNGHTGMVYGFDEAGQFYRFDPATGESLALGTGNVAMLPADMAYDYSTGLMYAIVYDAANMTTTLYTVNLSNGKLVPVATVDDVFLTLSCTTEGLLYGINATGALYELHIMDGEGGGGIAPLSEGTGKSIYANYVMQTPAESLFYAQTMCYDHNNDVLLWFSTDYGTMYVLAGLDGFEPYAVELGDPSGTGLIQYTGAYVIPDNIPKLPFVPVESVEGDDMMLLTGASKTPIVTIKPNNASSTVIDSIVLEDTTVASYDAKTGKIVGVGAGTTTATIRIIDCGLDKLPDETDSIYTVTITVTVKQSTDNIQGFLMSDLMTGDGYYFMEMKDSNTRRYTGLSSIVLNGMPMTIYSAEYVDGFVYAYGFNDQDWQANFQFMVIDARTWSVLSATDMGSGFPFVYDMAFDYTTGTMYALAGAGSNATDLFYVDLATGELITCMLVDPMMMSLTIDENGTIYGMAASVEHADPLSWNVIYDNALLYTLDVKNGTYEVFMDTGVKSNMLASMAYDFDTGYIYWTGLLSAETGYESGLYLIDPADKSCNSLGNIGAAGAQVTALMIRADEYPEIPGVLGSVALTTGMEAIGVGETVTLETFTAPFGVDATFTWTSADKSVARVDENGVVTGVSAGTTVITVTGTDGVNTLSATCTIKVYGADDYFISYNHTLGGFAKISRPGGAVTQFTEAEDASPVTAMAMVNGQIYGFDEEGNFFVTSESVDFERTYMGNCGITVAEPWEEHTETVDGESHYGYDYVYTPGFTVRDMAYDPVNNRILVLGTEYLHVVVDYWFESPTYSIAYEYADEIYEVQGGCKIYTVDLETGKLEELCTVGGIQYPMSGVTMLTVTDSGEAYAYSYYLDYIMKVDLETGLYTNLTTFQNMGVKGSDDNDLMGMVYDAGLDSLIMLFTTNGNSHCLYKFDLKTLAISFISYVGDVEMSYNYAYGDYFGGLVLNDIKSPVEEVMGDVNGDGLIDTTDAKLIMQYDLGLISEADLNIQAADVNGDGLIDTTDAKLIMQLDLGLITEFSKEN